MEIVAFKDKEGAVYCHLEGGSAFEKSTFINTLTEIVKPVENPRYIIVRKSRLFGILRQKDYHAVPEILATNKKIAMRFAENWRATVGSCNLVFTRTGEGRKFLLRARVRSLAAGLKGKPERVNKGV